MQTSSRLSRSRRNSKTPDKAIVGLGHPAIFHWGILVVLVGLLIFAAFQRMVPLLATTAFLLVVLLLSRFWSRHGLRGLTVGVSANRARAFPGEEVELTFELANRWLPLPWLEVEMELPYRLATGKRSSSPYTRERLRWVTALLPGQAITWKHTLEAKARGDYRLGLPRLRSGDMFGLFPKEMILSHSNSLLVYPQVFPLGKLSLPLRALFGEKAAPRSIYEDVSRVAGARDYRYGDSFKHIHWKASAAHNKLQTRQYESSTSLSLFLILDVHSFPEEDEEFERAVSTVASLAYEAHRQGFAVGLIANSEPQVQLPIASGQNQLLQILEALARITADSRTSLYDQMDVLRPVLPVGATLVVVARTRTAALAGVARQLEQDGHSLLLVGMEQTAGQEEEPAAVSVEGGTYA